MTTQASSSAKEQEKEEGKRAREADPLQLQGEGAGGPVRVCGASSEAEGFPARAVLLPLLAGGRGEQEEAMEAMEAAEVEEYARSCWQTEGAAKRAFLDLELEPAAKIEGLRLGSASPPLQPVS